MLSRSSWSVKQEGYVKPYKQDRGRGLGTRARQEPENLPWVVTMIPHGSGWNEVSPDRGAFLSILSL